MTTQQAIEALHALPRMGQGKPGLARMQNLMDHLGNPEKDLQCIHIAGTNGKGQPCGDDLCDPDGGRL